MRELLSPAGTLDRAGYARWGIALLAMKLSLDWLVASVVFERPWSVLHYYVLPLSGIEFWTAIDHPIRAYELTMLLMSLPFLWLGIALTVRRLRHLGWPIAIVLVFVLPMANVVLFSVLLIGSGEGDAARRAPVAGDPEPPPQGVKKAHLIALAIWLPLGTALLLGSTQLFNVYSTGLFVLLPFTIGFTCAIVWNYHGLKDLWSTIGVGSAVVLVLSLAFLLLGMEGLICLVMAGTMGLPVAWIGCWIGWHFMADLSKRSAAQVRARRTMSGALLCLPLMLGWEASLDRAPPTYEVTSSIVIDAPREVVWDHVVSFSEITEDPSLLFRAGIAYPLRATIAGAGPGAMRRCTFTTGDFIEPIEVWDEPNLLRFGVTACPPTMTEMSPWGEIAAPHLEGNFVSTRGQFLLETLPDGRTRLSGTTWYHQKLWPSLYWKAWADAIIHRIHMRVLRHIHRLAESA